MTKHTQRTLTLALIAALTACGGNTATTPQTTAPHSPPALSHQSPPVAFKGLRNDYTITRDTSGFKVTNKSGVSVTVASTAQVQFDDMRINLQIGDKANSIASVDLRALIDLYIAFFNRLPDADGLEYWIDQFKAGMSIDQISNNFYAAALLYSAQTGYDAKMTDEDFVRLIYKNVLGRTGDKAPPAADVKYWADELKNGRSKGNLISTMLVSARSFTGYAEWGWVPQLLDNKVAVATYFAVQQGINYNTPEESISKTIAIVANISPNSILIAQDIIGVSDRAFNLLNTKVEETSYKVNFKSTNGSIMDIEGTQIFTGKTIEVNKGDSLQFLYVPDRGFQSSGSKLLASPKCNWIVKETPSDSITPSGDCTIERNFVPVDDDYNGKPDKDEANFIVHSVEVSPKAIREADIGKTDVTFTLLATGKQGRPLNGSTTTTTISKVTIKTTLHGVGSAIDDLYESLQLFDDGTHGDEIANDNLFTATVRPKGFSDRFNTSFNRQMQVIMSQPVFLDASNNELQSFEANLSTKETALMIIKNSVPPSLDTPIKMADDIYRSRNFITIIDPIYTRRPDSGRLILKASKYITGNFDVAAIYNYGESYGGNWPALGHFNAPYSGIGIDLNSYRSSSTYGLPNLCGVMVFGTSTITGSVFNHEFGHCWSAYLSKPELPLGNGHWGIASESLAVMGHGLSLAGAPGNWKAVPSADYDRFSMLDLYLAGMADINEVPSMHYINDMNLVAMTRINDSIPDSKISFTTSADIVRVYGTRTPAYNGKVKNLRVLSIVIAAKPLTEAENTAMNIILSNQTGTGNANTNGDTTPAGFAVACRNRCTLSADIWTPIGLSPQFTFKALKRQH